VDQKELGVEVRSQLDGDRQRRQRGVAEIGRHQDAPEGKHRPVLHGSGYAPADGTTKGIKD
jgi:hypothetical protein